MNERPALLRGSRGTGTDDAHRSRPGARSATRRRAAALEHVLRRLPPGQRPVLVAGNGRSGTSWVGDVLGLPDEALYYREPCNPDVSRAGGDEVWSSVVPADGCDPYFEHRLDRAFAGLIVRGQAWYPKRRLERLTHASACRVVVKEVAAYPSVEWAASRYDAQVVLVTRHPCAVVASVADRGWHDLEVDRARRLWSRPDVRASLGSDAPDPARLTTPVEISAFVWAVKERLALQAAKRHPEWQIVVYEDLCAQPLERFTALIEACGLAVSPQVEAAIELRSSTESEGPYATSRRSIEHVARWRSVLSAAQVDRVRAVVDAIGPSSARGLEW